MLEQEEIRHKVNLVLLNIKEHKERINLDYFRLATYNIILGLL